MKKHTYAGIFGMGSLSDNEMRRSGHGVGKGVLAVFWRISIQDTPFGDDSGYMRHSPVQQRRTDS